MDSKVALNINWNFGFNKDVVNGVHNLSSKDRNAIFYLSSHSGVIYDYEYRRQTILQGHCNIISCCAVSKDKRWIVTADEGEDSILVVWDSQTGTPVKTIFSPHPGGCCSVDISDDSMFLVSLSPASSSSPQEIAVWAWSKDDDDSGQAMLRRNTLSKQQQNEIKYDSAGYNFVTTGPNQIQFWHTEEFAIDGYIGKIKKTSVGNFSGNLTSSVYIGDSGSAVSATDGGYLILWEAQKDKLLLDNEEKNKSFLVASKVVKLVNSGITLMVCTSNYIAVASKDGAVRFYDFHLRLEAWFEDLAAGPLSSLSFSEQDLPEGIDLNHFWVPDFVVGTTDALVVGVEALLFQEIRADDRRGTLLLQGMVDAVETVACHPNKSLMVLACVGGAVQVWDYDLKLLINLRELNQKEAPKTQISTPPVLIPVTMTFDRSGKYLVIGFGDGSVKFLHIDTLEDVQTLTPTQNAITRVVFSPSNQYFALSDITGRIILYKHEGDDFDENAPENQHKCPYTLIGRANCHKGKVVGLEFGTKEEPLQGQVEMLLSVGEDCMCREYNLVKSSPSAGVVCTEKSSQVELYAKPTTCAWYPYVGENTEDKFIIANDEYKFKEFNSETKQCRKTTMYPSFGGVIDKLICIGDNSIGHFVAFSTAEKIVGLASLPLTGNPYKMMGLVAHPGNVSCMSVSSDSDFIFTSGGSDLSINMWSTDFAVFDDKNASAEEEMTAFYSMLEGGKQGELKNDILDYFYYCQLRSQGEDTMEIRNTQGTIALDQIPYLMRAIGFYPTEEEIVNMINEIKYSDFMKTGVMKETIGFEEFVKLYLNHRPVTPISNFHIDFAFNEMRNHLNGDSQNVLEWDQIERLLTVEGEAISNEDLTSCLTALMGDESKKIGKAAFDSNQFADQVLGFEDTSVPVEGQEMGTDFFNNGTEEYQ